MSGRAALIAKRHCHHVPQSVTAQHHALFGHGRGLRLIGLRNNGCIQPLEVLFGMRRGQGIGAEKLAVVPPSVLQLRDTSPAAQTAGCRLESTVSGYDSVFCRHASRGVRRAERGGFEPPRAVYPPCRFSKPVHSTTLPSLQVGTINGFASESCFQRIRLAVALAVPTVGHRITAWPSTRKIVESAREACGGQP